MWKQWLISLTWFILILHPSLLFLICVHGLRFVKVEILILEPTHLVAFMLCFHSIHCRSNLNILKFVACSCGESGLVVGSLISSALNSLPPAPPFTWPGTRLQLKCYFLRGPIPETPAFSKSAVSIIISHRTFHFSFIAMPLRVRLSYQWIKTQNENGLSKVELYFSLMCKLLRWMRAGDSGSTVSGNPGSSCFVALPFSAWSFHIIVQNSCSIWSEGGKASKASPLFLRMCTGSCVHHFQLDPIGQNVVN